MQSLFAVNSRRPHYLFFRFAKLHCPQYRASPSSHLYLFFLSGAVFLFAPFPKLLVLAASVLRASDLGEAGAVLVVVSEVGTDRGALFLLLLSPLPVGFHFHLFAPPQAGRGRRKAILSPPLLTHWLSPLLLQRSLPFLRPLNSQPLAPLGTPLPPATPPLGLGGFSYTALHPPLYLPPPSLN